MSQRRRVSLALAISVTLLLAQLAAAPALSDPIAGAVAPSLRLETPWLYLLLAPLFTLWDGVSMLSMSRLVGFLTGLVALYLAWRILAIWRRGLSLVRESLSLAIVTALFAAFLVAGAVWHRPMLALSGTDPAEIVVDFHSHTSVSHDVRDTWMRGFDAEANRRWHTRAGFDAAFITDHNVVSRESGVGSQEVLGTGNREGSTVLCPGIEVSAWRAHVVLLGDTVPVDRRRYNGSLDELFALLRTSDSTYGALSVASLPEYRRNHWNRLDQLVAAGLDGFEIVNASPKANEITRPERDSVIQLAREHNRFVVGVSDSHGWGATSMVWNLVRSPAAEAGGDVCKTLLHQLGTGFSAVRIIERHRLRPDSWWPMWLTPVGVVWETWRSMGWTLAASWLVWIWVLAMGPRLMARHPARPPTAGRS
ncbi:MAG TPA: hypothetical protein VFS51_12135 [Gemmatimonadales bacterium]|nr:hypothetical protein [Gemmatimonadales bacterium]